MENTLAKENDQAVLDQRQDQIVHMDSEGFNQRGDQRDEHKLEDKQGAKVRHAEAVVQ